MSTKLHECCGICVENQVVGVQAVIFNFSDKLTCSNVSVNIPATDSAA